MPARVERCGHPLQGKGRRAFASPALTPERVPEFPCEAVLSRLEQGFAENLLAPVSLAAQMLCHVLLCRPGLDSIVGFDLLGEQAALARQQLIQRQQRPGTEDRKSTRLNSSHVAISYAV